MVLNGVSSKASMILLGEKTVKRRGILPTVASGVGVDMTIRALDKLVGSPLTRFAGFNVPFLGNVGVIDALNFLIFSSGGKNMKSGLVAVAGAKVVGGTLPALGSLSLPGSVGSGVGSPVAAGVAGAEV